ncbi:MAG: hypothetical protein ACR2N7_10255 [Acidimicrobiia bacterium]
MAVRARVSDLSLPAIDRRLVVGGLLAAAAAALVLVLTQPPDRVPVLVVGADAASGVALSDLDIGVHYVDSADGLVEGSSLGELESWSLSVPLAAGEPLLQSLLRPPAMSTMPNLLALSLAGEHALLGQLNAGDLVDVYVTPVALVGEVSETSLVANDIYVVDATTSDNPADRGRVDVLVAVDDALAPILANAARSGGIDLVKVSP